MEDDKSKLINFMLEKSQEAFLLSIELYNKPTIKSRLESSVIFLCNAWELLLKAKIVNDENIDAIYYKNNKSRTITLKEAIKKIMTNDKDPIRTNLELIVDLRDKAIHLIIPEFNLLYSKILTPCAKHYSSKIFEYFSISINNKTGLDFMNLYIPSENNKIDILGKYGEKINEEYLEFNDTVFNTLKANDFNPDICIDYKLTFAKINDKNKADFTYYLDKNNNNQKIVEITKIKDPENHFIYTHNKIVKVIDTELRNMNLRIYPMSEVKYKNSNENKYFTSSHFIYYIEFNNIKEKKDDNIYAYTFTYGNKTNTKYSHNLVDKIINDLKKDPYLIRKYKKR